MFIFGFILMLHQVNVDKQPLGVQMARETKHERIVRAMQDQIYENLVDLKRLADSPSAKELDVERWCQNVLKNCLGYTAIAGYSIMAQESRGKCRPDLIVSKNDKPLFVVEIKRLGFDLNKSDFRSGKTQLKEYLSQIGSVRWGILCNGYEWRLYDFSNPSVGGIEIVNFDLQGENEELDLTKSSVEETCWNFFDLHEASYISESWFDFSKEATAFSPDSLARAILSLDVVKHIARAIRGEFEYKANLEVLIEKVAVLLENGLDDSVPGWNETKHAELYKYIKAQKRAGRRRNRRKDVVEVAASEVQIVAVDALTELPESKKGVA